MNWRDKVILITGGSSGIGKATALAFAGRGANVVIASRDPERGEQALTDIREVGEALWVQTDVSQADQVAALVQTTIETYGRLDYAFNNGGSGGQGGWIADLNEEDWNATLHGYLTSVFLCMKYEIGAMLKTGGGVIVNNASVDGLRAFPWDPAYSAAKHGVIGLTKSTALQYAQQGIRINAVCPGWTRTPPIQQWIDNDPEAEGRMLQHQPIGRLGEPEEIAEAVVWLCSDGGSLVTGIALPVDGGYTAL
ncbi:MAG: glucose 1-dehydrogenase [Anaerolineae bacterium]|nr:glucose 1-dehydrogenase [Anaerolineae bacterium]